MNISWLRLGYLCLATLGAAHWVFLAATSANAMGAGIDLPGFWHLVQSDFAETAGFWIAGLAMFFWVLAETYVRKNWMALIVLPVTFLSGFGVGLPLYLFLRTRPVA